MGRNLQREFDQEPQVIITTPLLEGLDGVKKMSKSLGNYIGIDEPANEMFGKVMSISDDLMWKYYELLTDLSHLEITDLRPQIESGENPRNIKVNLAKLIIKDFHSQTDADAAEEDFRPPLRPKRSPGRDRRKTDRRRQIQSGATSRRYRPRRIKRRSPPPYRARRREG